MSLKKDLLEPNVCRYIPLFDTDCLDMREECLLSYIIDLADYKNADDKEIEITVKYVQIRKPNWKERDIKQALNGLCEKGFINLEGTHGRGNCYTLNIEFINEQLISDEEVSDDEKVVPIKNLESACENLIGRVEKIDRQTIKNYNQSITNQKQTQKPINNNYREFNNSPNTTNLDGGRVLNGEKDFDKYICSLKNSQTQQVPVDSSTTDENNIKMYLLGKDYPDDIRKLLVKHYMTLNNSDRKKSDITLRQVHGWVNNLNIMCGNDYDKMRKVIKYNTERLYFGFYEPSKQQYNNNQINTITFNHKQVEDKPKPNRIVI